VAGGSVTLTNDTFSRNYADGGSGDGGGAASGGGIDVAPGGKVLLHNTLIAASLAGDKPADIGGSLDSTSNYNLIGNGSGGLSTANHNVLGSSSNPIDPLLAVLGSYGGPTLTLALLPGSPALDAGSSSYGGNTDQRGKPRVGATDIGAFESQGFTLTLNSGNNQTAAINTAFANPLLVSVTANNTVEPVAGGRISFTAPASGASAVLKSSPALIGAKGQASVTATANGTAGSYTVSASARGVASAVKFSLTNTAPATTLAALPPSPSALTQPVLAPLASDNPLALDQSPLQALDLVWAELGLSWDLLLAGGNVHVLRNDPPPASLSRVIGRDCLYQSWEG
jgi:hypothetical protein